MLADIMQIIMLETTEAARVKMYEDYDYLGIAHAVGLATVSFTVLRSFEHGFFLLRIKNLQNSSAKQKISVTLSSENIAVRGCLLFC